jgi:superfamily II DNA/RNA helicase
MLGALAAAPARAPLPPSSGMPPSEPGGPSGDCGEPTPGGPVTNRPPAAGAGAGAGGSANPAMWGGCSIGPVLRAQLEASGKATPLPIQEQAFAPISKGRNVVLGSATGSGKTLAFLLPIVASSRRDTACRTLIVTGSRELARQLRREVDVLWPPRELAAEGRALSAVHIVGGESADAADGVAGDAGDDQPQQSELVDLGNALAPIIVGPPHALRRLMAGAKEALNGRAASPEGREAAQLLRENLKVVVIDEADQLLESDRRAQLEIKRRETVERQSRALTARQRGELKRRAGPSVTEALLSELPRPLSTMQLVCASATVGRTLRRQLQAVLGSPSIDKAAELIAPPERDRKQRDARRAALVPATLRHQYLLVDPGAGDAGERPAAGIDVDGQTEEEFREEKEEQGGGTGSGVAGPMRGRDRGRAPTLETLSRAMRSMVPAPAIVFAGRYGVEHVMQSLKQAGLKDVRLVKDAHRDAAERGVERGWGGGGAEGGGAERGAAGESGDGGVDEGGLMEKLVVTAARPDTSSGSSPAASPWAETPVYVGVERWARGLDLEVEYVFMLSPPASSASYAHLAGRTGRRGRNGTAITLLTHTQAPRLVAFAEQLGIPFTPVLQQQCQWSKEEQSHE